MDRPLFFEFSGFRFLEELKTRSLFFFSGEPFGSFTGLKIPQKKEKKRRRRTVVRSIPDLPSMEPTAAFPTDLWCCARPVPHGPRRQVLTWSTSGAPTQLRADFVVQFARNVPSFRPNEWIFRRGRVAQLQELPLRDMRRERPTTRLAVHRPLSLIHI